ncbi:hypothetical protein M885DRAFT_540384 [Pelagophyceae sp. CCMP2097]|nr:hypothetical protein M885DRAFT_540384 [Pelagophyceae sp. CCMP2097]
MDVIDLCDSPNVRDRPRPPPPRAASPPARGAPTFRVDVDDGDEDSVLDFDCWRPAAGAAAARASGRRPLFGDGDADDDVVDLCGDGGGEGDGDGDDDDFNEAIRASAAASQRPHPPDDDDDDFAEAIRASAAASKRPRPPDDNDDDAERTRVAAEKQRVRAAKAAAKKLARGAARVSARALPAAAAGHAVDHMQLRLSARMRDGFAEVVHCLSDRGFAVVDAAPPPSLRRRVTDDFATVEWFYTTAGAAGGADWAPARFVLIVCDVRTGRAYDDHKRLLGALATTLRAAATDDVYSAALVGPERAEDTSFLVGLEDACPARLKVRAVPVPRAGADGPGTKFLAAVADLIQAHSTIVKESLAATNQDTGRDALGGMQFADLRQYDGARPTTAAGAWKPFLKSVLSAEHATAAVVSACPSLKILVQGLDADAAGLIGLATGTAQSRRIGATSAAKLADFFTSRDRNATQ